MLKWSELPRPIVALAPMADLCDLPFCVICRELGAPLVFRGMVSSEALVRNNARTFEMCAFEEQERPVIAQIFGSDPTAMAEAARLIEEKFKPDGIDINMGCPVHNIVSNFNGASLMREPEKAGAIVKAVKEAISLPVSVKMRLGWKNDTDAVEFAKRIEFAGADMIAIHGRTKEQGYSGTANWKRVGEAKAGLRIPVLVNGDIINLETSAEALAESGADGVLIGRGALGNPWVLGRIHKGLKGVADLEEPTMEEILRVVRRHAELQARHYGESGLIKLRKHLPMYFKGMPGMKDIRSALVRVSSLNELSNLLDLTLKQTPSLARNSLNAQSSKLDLA